jgi:alkylhydroperoxidase family enzyme
VAAHHLGGNEDLVAAIRNNFENAAISEKLKALLAIAGKVQRSGKDVQTEDIERARNHGASDLEIHDTVLIAAMFCLANRYVDGLATLAPQEPDLYRELGAQIAQNGYAGAVERVRTTI